jgi:hypothetical protein
MPTIHSHYVFTDHCLPLPTVHLSYPHCSVPTVYFALPTVFLPLATTHGPLPIVYCLLPTAHCPLFSAIHPLSIVHCRMFTAHCPQPTVPFPLFTALFSAQCLLSTTYYSSFHCLLPMVHCPRFTAPCLLPSTCTVDSKQGTIGNRHRTVAVDSGQRTMSSEYYPVGS